MASRPPPSAKPGGAANEHPKPAPSPLIHRGNYNPNPLGTTTFIGLRTLDPLLQYNLLAHGWGASLLSSLHLPSLPLHAHPPSDYLSYPSLPKDSAHILTALETVSPSDLPISRLVLLLMSTGSTLKQIYWLLRLSHEEFTPSTAISVAGYNTVVNTLASLLLLCPSTSSALASGPKIPLPGRDNLALSLPTAVGIVLYAVGISLETISEVQRERFKRDARNKGKIITTGLWGWARHINYGGYTLWRTGYGLAAGGWVAGGLVAAWHAWIFVRSSVPELRGYMMGKYKEQWVKYEEKVKWVLIPGVY
ncbi:hypothetical protein B0T16DRAFT_416659 [Cercophora newfieldiana]|uniref:Steroid 5-alpha reductase C-terminal domain-containing protein n=1 Tax=Cercophora newfieldiana TaxID=92897 RepID=A0AA39Y126_9PEZI|nr:hypothetical protein B0T16DRAFT_416659 [Cercophora newfieldiana]